MFTLSFSVLAMTCPAARPPQNAVLVLPCVEEYKSECLVKCKHGYYMAGNATIKCGLDAASVRWNFNNAKCQGKNFYSIL